MQPKVHPTAEELKAFGLGKLNDAAETAVAAHLDTCADCRKTVESLPPDSMVKGLRAAGVTAGPSATMAPSANDRGDVPPELLSHAGYEILRELGRGGMGVVYLAKNRLMERLEVLKVISGRVVAKPGALERFRREIVAAARLRHPNIVTAYQTFQVDRLWVLAMEYVDGLDLGEVLKKHGSFPIQHACNYVRQAALGLQHAAEQGMAHRDIKPANLMLSRKGEVKILDFGLARLGQDDMSQAALSSAVAPGLTMDGVMMGTPDYVAPEQIDDAKTADIRSDIYSLGCTLFGLLAGHPPYQEPSFAALIAAQLHKPAPDIRWSRPDAPDELAGIIARMMAKRPAERYQSPAEVARALAPFTRKEQAIPVARAVMPTHLNASPSVTPMPWESLVTNDTAVAPPLAEPVGRSRRGLFLGIGGAFIGLLALLFALGVFRVKTKDGVIVIEDLPADAVVSVDGNTVEVRRLGEKEPVVITVEPGTHEVTVTKRGFKAASNRLTVDAGGKTPWRVKLVPDEPESKERLTDLSSAKSILDLDFTKGAEGCRIAEFEHVRLSHQNHEYKYAAKRLNDSVSDIHPVLPGLRLRNYVVEVQARMTEKSRGAWGMRFSDVPGTSCDLKILHDGRIALEREGKSTFKSAAPVVATPNDWHTYRLEVQDAKTVVFADGKWIDTRSDERLLKGPVSFHLFVDELPFAVEFRRIRIWELPERNPPPVPETKPRSTSGMVVTLDADFSRGLCGAMPFDGVSLRGGLMGGEYLFSAKVNGEWFNAFHPVFTDRNYHNFIFEAESRSPASAPTSWCLRFSGRDGMGEHALNFRVHREGAMEIDRAIKKTPFPQNVRLRDWNRYRLEVFDRNLRMFVNDHFVGETTVANYQPSVLAPFISAHDLPAEVRFRHISIWTPRNPFSLWDVAGAQDQEVRDFAARVTGLGKADDQNAPVWPRQTVKRGGDDILGNWSGRWNGGMAKGNWSEGVAEIRQVDDTVFIYFADSGRYLIEAKRTGNRLVGRFQNANRVQFAGDTSPWVGEIVNNERIDGIWREGRWDFRRRVEADKK